MNNIIRRVELNRAEFHFNLSQLFIDIRDVAQKTAIKHLKKGDELLGDRKFKK